MTRTLNQILRPFIPNLGLRIRHLEPGKTLNVRLRQHLGLVSRGARSYEANYVDIFRDLVREDDLVFDVGANIGFYAILFSSWVGASGKVLAYEPDPANLRLLERNVGDNKCANVVIRNSALGKKSGRESFSVDRTTGSTGHLGTGPTYAETLFGDGQETLVHVEVTTLDQEVERWGPPQLIKIDVEGGELDVLTGAGSVLQHERPILVTELSDWSDQPGAETGNASLATALLSNHKYTMWNLDSGAIVRGGDVGWMVLAVPEERLKEDRVIKTLTRLKSISSAI